jgi:SH3-like domain-containing protein
VKRILLFFLVFALLCVGEASAERLAVSVGRVNVRSGPGTDFDILWSLEKYYPVDVINKRGDWYQTRDFEDDEGWIYGPLLKRIPALVVKVPRSNVREGPGTTFRMVFQAEKGVPFKRLDKKGNWFKIQHADGQVGWIHKNLVWGY